MQILRTVNTDREISYVSMLGLFCSSPLLFEVNSDQFLIFYESARNSLLQYIVDTFGKGINIELRCKSVPST